MRRKCTDSLIYWKKNPGRKPLILQGLRQTGKTWLLMDFGNKQYEHTLYINLETDRSAADYLSVPHDPQEVLLFLETCAGKPLRPASSLQILDNIQCIPQISTLLTSIALDFPQYHIASIYKGVVNSDSFSVHDFDILTLYPLDFEEFLWANAEFALTREIRNHFSDFSSMGKKLHEKALSQFRLYLIIGGMPAAIMEYKKEKKLLLVPDTQQKLLNLFLSDITALAPKGTTRHCRNAWLSIPAQLGRTSRKFQYTRIAKGATAKVYHEPLQWLISAGLAIPCQTAVCSRPSETSLHLYPVDTGLCSCILKIPAFQLLSGEETTAGTACIETFLAQHFIRNGYALSYWSSGNQAEVPFLLSKNSHFIAIDYRTTPHQKCRNLMQLNKSSLSPAPTQMYLISAEDFRQKEAYRIVPLYAVFCI